MRAQRVNVTSNYDDANKNIDDKRERPKRYWRIPDFFPNMDQEVQQKLLAYQTELIHFNGRINLISSRTEQQADLIHITDCVTCSEMILRATDQKEIFDIGSGNGLPGVVLAILDPERQIIVVDKDARKMEFLKHVSSRLFLKNVTFYHQRVEDIEPNRIHCAVSRGFASITKAIIALRKPCSLNAEYYHMKSDSWVREIAQIPTQLCSFWEPSLIGEYKLPITNAQLSLVLTKKIA